MNDYVIITPVEKNGRLRDQILIRKKSKAQKTFEQVGMSIVWAIYLAIIGFMIWVFQAAY